MNLGDMIFGFIIGALISALLTFSVVIGLKSVYVINDTVISYEYTTQCRCGGTIEGYQSLVDDYTREECKSCGYHKE